MELVRLLFRNLLRHKLRSLLTLLGVGVAVLAFALLRTVVTAWYAGVEASAANRLITRHAVSFVFPLPLAYRDRIAQVAGVDRVTYAIWFSGVYIDKNQFFARLAVDAETFFDVYREFLIEPEQFEAFKRERNATIIGSDIAKRYNLKLGDIMTLDGDVYPGQWQLVVRGIYRPREQSTDPATMMFHYRYVEERVRQEMPERAGNVGWYIIRIHDPDRSAAVSEAIDRLFRLLPASKENAQDVTVRGELQIAAWMSFFGEVNTAMGMSHILGRRVGARYDVPHGVTSCITLPWVMEAEAARKPAPLAAIGRRIAREARMEGESKAARAAAQAMRDLVSRLGLPARLSQVGVPHNDLASIAEAAYPPGEERARALELLERMW